MKTALLIIAGAVLMSAVVLLETHRTRVMDSALPPIYWIERHEADGVLRAHFGRAAWVLGTGSMQPAIRAGLPTEKVAIVLYDPGLDYSLLGEGRLVIFNHLTGLIVHQLAKLDGDGWISTGSANAHYDSGRVTRENYRGVVTAIYNIKP